MDAHTFDTLIAQVASGSRRRLLAGLTATALATFPLALGNDAAAEKCSPCRKKRRGRCKKPLPDTTPCRECGVCLDGVCTPAKIDCGGVCTYCDESARCRAKPDGTPCLGAGTCQSGVCEIPV